MEYHRINNQGRCYVCRQYLLIGTDDVTALDLAEIKHNLELLMGSLKVDLFKPTKI